MDTTLMTEMSRIATAALRGKALYSKTVMTMSTEGIGRPEGAVLSLTFSTPEGVRAVAVREGLDEDRLRQTLPGSRDFRKVAAKDAVACVRRVRVALLAAGFRGETVEMGGHPCGLWTRPE